MSGEAAAHPAAIIASSAVQACTVVEPVIRIADPRAIRFADPTAIRFGDPTRI